MTSTVLPAWARAAAMLTVVVVLPTPPFWLATVSTRVRGGRGTARPLNVMRRRASSATARASGVCSSAPGIAAAIWARCSVSSCRVGLGSMPSSRAWVVLVPLSTRPPTATSSSCGSPRSTSASAGAAASVSRAEVVVSRETVSGPGHPRGLVVGPASRGNPSPGAADRSSATSIVVLTRPPSCSGPGRADSTPRTPDTPKRHPHTRPTIPSHQAYALPITAPPLAVSRETSATGLSRKTAWSRPALRPT